jgi:hypothetical protein
MRNAPHIFLPLGLEGSQLAAFGMGRFRQGPAFSAKTPTIYCCVHDALIRFALGLYREHVDAFKLDPNNNERQLVFCSLLPLLPQSSSQ